MMDVVRKRSMEIDIDALKEDFSNYRSNLIVQNGNSEVAIKAAQALANKHPDSSIIFGS
jgi:hypothetical protein